MSHAQVLAIVPSQRPVTLAELQNAHGWAPGIWRRLLVANGYDEHWITNDVGLIRLWEDVEALPEWQQVPLVLTFDTGVIPFKEFTRAADLLEEFDQRLSAPQGHVNHISAVAKLLRGAPECDFIGIWGTSVTMNPFDPWDDEADAPGLGIPLDQMYVLERHRAFLAHQPQPLLGEKP